MSASVRGVLGRTVAGLGVAVLAIGLTAGTAAADSPVRWAYENDGASLKDCGGQWISKGNDFRLKDGDRHDDDWCYIDYSYQSDHDPDMRVRLPQDKDTKWHRFGAANPSGAKYIHFQVCQERQDDPDICTVWKKYRT